MATKKQIAARIAKLTELGFAVEADTYKNGTYVIAVETINKSTDSQWEDELKKYEDSKIPFVEAEHIQPEAGVAVMQLSVEDVTKNEIAKLDINEQKIQAVKRECMKITISHLNDKDNIKKAQEAKSKLRKMRTGVEAKRKEIKADYLKIGAGIDAAAKKYTTAIEEIEERIDAELDKYEAWKKEEDERIEREAAKLLKDRVDILIGAGMVFNSLYYVIGPAISIGIDVIKVMKEEDFNSLLERVKAEKKRIDEEAARQERITQRRGQCMQHGMFTKDWGFKYPFDGDGITVTDEDIADSDDERWGVVMNGVVTFIDDFKRKEQEAKDKLKKQQEEQEAEAKRLAQEAEDLRREKIQMREEMASNSGLIFDPATLEWKFANKYTSQSISKKDIEELPTAEYSKLIKDVSFAITTAKNNAEADDKKEQQRMETINSRTAQLLSLGMRKTNDPIHGYEYANETYGHSGIAPAADWRDMPDAGWATHLRDLEGKINVWVQNEIDKKAQEQRDINRNAQCQQLGMAKGPHGYKYPITVNKSVLVNGYDSISVTDAELEHAHDADWDKTIKGITDFIEAHKIALKAETDRRQTLFDDRCNFFIDLGMKKEGVFFFYKDAYVDPVHKVDVRAIEHCESDDDFYSNIYNPAVEAINTIKTASYNRRKEIEEQRQKALPEIERAKEYFFSLVSMELPIVETEGIRLIMMGFSRQLASIVADAQKDIECLL